MLGVSKCYRTLTLEDYKEYARLGAENTQKYRQLLIENNEELCEVRETLWRLQRDYLAAQIEIRNLHAVLISTPEESSQAYRYSDGLRIL